MKNGFVIADELKKLPDKPGVYLMHDERDEIIYVGKAVVLKNRVRQYFQSERRKTAKIRRMIQQIAWFEYIVTDSETEALVLECNLIKEYRPKYNTMLVDDKGYPFICVTVDEKYPRVFKTRNPEKGKHRYFGPYTSAFAVKDTLALLNKISMLRTCRKSLPKEEGKSRPCLNYDLGLCMAPCTGRVSQEAYRENVNRVIGFLSGDDKEIIADLKKKMSASSDANDFETAMQYRDLIREVQHVSGHQKITDMSSRNDRDFIAVSHEEEKACAAVFYVRDGALIGRDTYLLTVAEGETKPDIIESFVKQYYAGMPNVPKEIFVEHDFGDREALEEMLSAKCGRKITVHVPKKGEKEHFLSLAYKNASMTLEREKERILAERKQTVEAAEDLASLLSIPSAKRIEAFDISNISGYASVGSMVVFENGRPKKNDYRKFRIKTVSGPNDYASMKEVLTRRFLKITEEDNDTSFHVLPDLLLMDGGKGQVHIAEEVLTSLGLSVAVAGMVKDDRHRTRDLYFQGKLLSPDAHSEVFHLITRVQDEAHRFAITYHRGLHTKDSVKSVLSEIPGVGPKRENALIRAFSDIDALKKAGMDEIARAEGFNKRVAKEVYAFLHPEENEKCENRNKKRECGNGE